MGTLSTVCWLGLVIAASGPESTVRPLEPRPGARIGFERTHPKITLRWEDSQQSTRYIVQVSRKSSSGNIVATYEVRGSKSFVFEPDACGSYSWWVTGTGTAGHPGQPSKASTFRVFLRAPVLSTPRNGQRLAGAGQPLAFGWSKRPVAGYRFELARDRAFKHKQKRLSVTRPKISLRVARAGRYFWRVRGTRPGTPWSRVRSFKLGPSGHKPHPVAANTGGHKPPDSGQLAQLEHPPEKKDPNQFPAAPRLQAPRDASRINSPKPRAITLFWGAVGGAAGYEVDLSSKVKFSGAGRRRVNAPMLRLSDPPRGTLFWRVRAVDQKGNKGNWSAARRFSYQVQPLWKD